MRNLNNRNVLTTTASINRPLKKNVEKIILKIRIQYVPSSAKVGSFLLRNPRVKHYVTLCSNKQIRSLFCSDRYQSLCMDLSFFHNAAIKVVTN
jgi:hypothetical protein